MIWFNPYGDPLFREKDLTHLKDDRELWHLHIRAKTDEEHTEIDEAHERMLNSGKRFHHLGTNSKQYEDQVSCGRHDAIDVIWTSEKNRVTCQYCLKKLNKNN